MVSSCIHVRGGKLRSYQASSHLTGDGGRTLLRYRYGLSCEGQGQRKSDVCGVPHPSHPCTQYPDYTIMRLSCSRRDAKIARCGIGVCRHRGPRAPRKHVVIDGVEKGLERFAFAPKLRALFVGACYTGK